MYCLGEESTICPATTLVFLHTLGAAHASCRLADWWFTPRTCYGQCPSPRRTWSTLLWLSCFLRPSRCWRVPLFVAALDFLLVLKKCLITVWSKSVSVWRHSMIPWYTFMLLSFCQHSWHHLYADFSHAQMFGDNFSFFMFSWLAFIQTVSRWSPHTTYLNRSMIKFFWPGSYLSPPDDLFWTSCATHVGSTCVILIHLHFKCLWQSFPPSNPPKIRFIRCSTLIVCSSVLIAERPEKEM